MALDGVKALKLESTALGSALDTYPTEVSPLTGDALLAAGLLLQSQTASAEDKVVVVDRTGTSLRMTDGTTSHVLSELVSLTTGQVGSHDALRDLQHFLAGEGPGPGFASGTYRTRSYTGALLTLETWWSSSAQSLKILTRQLAYVSGTPLVSTETWTLYGPTGATLRTLVDTHTYSGPQIIATTRTWG